MRNGIMIHRLSDFKNHLPLAISLKKNFLFLIDNRFLVNNHKDKKNI